MHQLKIEVKSTKAELDKILAVIKEKLISDLGSDNWKHFYVAFQEALQNAYEHGSLNLTSLEKAKFLENNSLDKELKNREELFGSKIITIEIFKKADALIISIEDQGLGFNQKEFMQNKEKKDMPNISLSGRGLSLIKTGSDQVEFNEVGNKIILTKFL